VSFEHPPAASLALVPGAGADGAGVQLLRPLAGGSVNQSWRVQTGIGDYVLRIAGGAQRAPGVDRRFELAVHRRAAEFLLAPEVVASDIRAGMMVTRFCDGRAWTELDFSDGGQLRRLGEQLNHLHRIPADLAESTAFAPLRLAKLYADLALNRAAATHSRQQLEALVAEVGPAQQVLELSGQRVLVHGDMTAGNLLDDGRLWLIDWEYAQVTDPVYDLAALWYYHPTSRQHENLLLESAGIYGAAVGVRLAAATALHRVLGALWFLARGEIAPNTLESGAASGQTSAP
jgi:thiamine kinase